MRSTIRSRHRLLGLLLAFALAAGPAVADPGLFADVSLARSQLSEDQVQFYDRLQEAGTTVEIRLVRLRLDPAAEEQLTLNLFPGESYTLKTARVERRSATNYTWFGNQPKVALQAILVVNGEHVTGSVVDGDRHYAIRPLGGGLAAVVRIEPQNFPPDHPPEYDSLEEGVPAVPIDEKAGCSYVDLIVAFTIDAGNAVADIYGLAQLAVAETNQSHANSGVVHRVRMVHFYGTNYYDSGNMVTDRNRFRDNGDGYMDEVHILRNAFRADVGVLITDAGFYCGIASAIYASSSTAFAVVAQNCATGYYSFGHEIGHLHGARHNTQADPSTTPYAYGHGYYYQPGSWRTVMSYNCPGGCTRIPYWSNPYVNYGGVPMGTTSTNDNHRVLNITCSHVAGFR